MTTHKYHYSSLKNMAQSTISPEQAKETSLETRIGGIIRFLDDHIDIIRWEDDEIAEKFAKRSANKILEQGNVHYMNPCLDYTLVAYDKLRKEGFHPTWIVEEIRKDDRPCSAVHFVIELIYEGETYYLDFKKHRQVVFSKGEYPGFGEGKETINIIRQRKTLDPDKNMFENMPGIETFFDYFDFQATIEHLQRENAPHKFNQYLDELSAEGHKSLYLVTQASHSPV